MVLNLPRSLGGSLPHETTWDWGTVDMALSYSYNNIITLNYCSSNYSCVSL
jgi:hypothetical protein